MNTTRILSLALLAAVAMKLTAQEPAVAQSEMQKWIATTNAQWQAAFKRDVRDVREAELNKVKLQFLTALEDAIKKASAANDLKAALALRDEQKRFAETNVFPEPDLGGEAAVVKAIRTAIRAQLAATEKNNAARANALHAKYDQVLAQAQAQLTRAERLDDAVLVQTKRDEVKAAWLAGLPAAPAAMPEQPKPKAPLPSPAAAATPATGSAGNLFKNANFDNGTEGWSVTDSKAVTVDAQELHNGKPSVRITNAGGTRTMVMQKVSVQPKSRYMLRGYIKTKDVIPTAGPGTKKGSNEGAELVVDGPLGGSRRGTPVSGTSGWKEVKYIVLTTASETEITVGFALGHYYHPASGTAWFSEVSLTDLSQKN